MEYPTKPRRVPFKSQREIFAERQKKHEELFKSIDKTFQEMSNIIRAMKDELEKYK